MPTLLLNLRFVGNKVWISKNYHTFGVGMPAWYSVNIKITKFIN